MKDFDPINFENNLNDDKIKKIINNFLKPLDEEKNHYKLLHNYWTITIFKLLNFSDNLKEQEILNFVLNCKNKNGGYGAYINHISSIFDTLRALQILYQLRVDFFDIKTVDFIMSCYKNGKFYETVVNDSRNESSDESQADSEKYDNLDKMEKINDLNNSSNSNTEFLNLNNFLEEDNRLNAAGLISLVLLDNSRRKSTDLLLSEEFLEILNKKGFEKEKIINNLVESQNGDGGFGSIPRAESHGAMSYCCLISLNILNALENIDKNKAKIFLLKRTLKNGKFAGRPYKLEDSCYSYWIPCSLYFLNNLDKIEINESKKYILDCFNDHGFSYRPNERVDGHHTTYALLGKKLLEVDESERMQIAFGVYNNL